MKITPATYTVISETINDHKRQEIPTYFLSSDDFVVGESQNVVLYEMPLWTRSAKHLLS